MSALLQLPMVVFAVEKDLARSVLHVCTRAVSVETTHARGVSVENLMATVRANIRHQDINSVVFITGEHKHAPINTNASALFPAEAGAFSLHRFYSEGMLVPVLGVQVTNTKTCMLPPVPPNFGAHQHTLAVLAPSSTDAPALLKREWFFVVAQPTDSAALAQNTLRLREAVRDAELPQTILVPRPAARSLYRTMAIHQTLDPSCCTLTTHISHGRIGSTPTTTTLKTPLPFGLSVFMKLVEAKRTHASLITPPTSTPTFTLAEAFGGRRDTEPLPQVATLDPLHSGTALDIQAIRNLHAAFVLRRQPAKGDLCMVWGPVPTTNLFPERAVVATALRMFCSIPKGQTRMVTLAQPKALGTIHREQVTVPWDALACESPESWVATTRLATLGAQLAYAYGLTPSPSPSPSPSLAPWNDLPHTWVTLSSSSGLFVAMQTLCNTRDPTLEDVKDFANQLKDLFIQQITSLSALGHLSVLPTHNLPVGVTITIHPAIPLLTVTHHTVRGFLGRGATLTTDSKTMVARVVSIVQTAVRIWNSCIVGPDQVPPHIYFPPRPFADLGISTSNVHVALGNVDTKYMMCLADFVAHGTRDKPTPLSAQDTPTTFSARFANALKTMVGGTHRAPGGSPPTPTPTTTTKPPEDTITIVDALFCTNVEDALPMMDRPNAVDTRHLMDIVMCRMRSEGVKTPYVAVVHFAAKFRPGTLTADLTQDTCTLTTMTHTGDTQFKVLYHTQPTHRIPNPSLPAAPVIQVTAQPQSRIFTTVVFGGEFVEDSEFEPMPGNPSASLPKKWIHFMKPLVSTSAPISVSSPETMASFKAERKATLYIVKKGRVNPPKLEFSKTGTTPKEMLFAETGIHIYGRPEETRYQFPVRKPPVLFCV